MGNTNFGYGTSAVQVGAAVQRMYSIVRHDDVHGYRYLHLTGECYTTERGFSYLRPLDQAKKMLEVLRKQEPHSNHVIMLEDVASRRVKESLQQKDTGCKLKMRIS